LHHDDVLLHKFHALHKPWCRVLPRRTTRPRPPLDGHFPKPILPLAALHTLRPTPHAPNPQEFEDARVETDPEIINKLIITGRDAVARTMESFMKRRNAIIEDEAAARERGSLAAPPPQDGYPRPRGGSMGGGSSGGILGVPPPPRKG